jgi:hypothetical protein
MMYQLRSVLKELYRHAAEVTGNQAPTTVDVLDDAILLPHLSDALGAFVTLKRKVKQLESAAPKQPHLNSHWSQLSEDSPAEVNVLRVQLRDANTQLEHLRQECDQHRKAVTSLGQQLCAAKQQAGNHDLPAGSASPSHSCPALSAQHADGKQLLKQLQHLERCNAQLQQQTLQNAQNMTTMRQQAAHMAHQLHLLQESYYMAQTSDDSLRICIRDLADMAGDELVDAAILMDVDRLASSGSPGADSCESRVLHVTNNILQQQVRRGERGRGEMCCPWL